MPGASNMRPLLEALRKQPVAILLDVPYTKGSAGLVAVPFFGQQAFFPEGTVKLAKKTGALIQPFCVEEHRHGLILNFLPAHEVGTLSADESMALLVADIEGRIRSNPGALVAMAGAANVLGRGVRDSRGIEPVYTVS